MNLIQKLNEALQWYQKGYHITNDPDSIKVTEGFVGAVATFGTIENDGYKVTLYFYRDGRIDRFFFNDENGSIETTDQDIADNLFHMNGAFMDFIYTSATRLEKMEEERYRNQNQNQSKVSLNPLD